MGGTMQARAACKAFRAAIDATQCTHLDEPIFCFGTGHQLPMFCLQTFMNCWNGFTFSCICDFFVFDDAPPLWPRLRLAHVKYAIVEDGGRETRKECSVYVVGWDQ